MRVYDMNQLAEFGNLCQIDDSKNYLLSGAAEPALAIKKSGTMANFPEDAIRNFQRFSGYDECRFSLRSTNNDPVSYIGGQVHAD